jgi:hypothetical protein
LNETNQTSCYDNNAGQEGTNQWKIEDTNHTFNKTAPTQSAGCTCRNWAVTWVLFQKTGHARTLTWFGIALIALSVRFAYAMRIPQPESNQEAGSNGDTSWAYENLWEDDKYQGFGLLQLNKTDSGWQIHIASLDCKIKPFDFSL